jgi:large subunit ribosomal protein L25
MTETTTLTAELRSRAGTGGARETRRNGRTPAVIYGNKTEPMMISLDSAELARQVRRHGFLNHVFDINVGGRQERVIPRDVQNHPLTGRPLHVDFMRVSATTEISVDVEVVFLNDDKAPGLKRGGVLNVVMRTIPLECRPDAIPEQLTVDLTGLEIGDTVHLSAITLPPGVTLADGDGDATVASIAPPTAEAAPTAAAEGEETAAG